MNSKTAGDAGASSQAGASAQPGLAHWLEQLAAWQGRPADYWPQLARVTRALLSARAALVCSWPESGDAAGPPQVVACEPAHQLALVQPWLREVPASLWRQARHDGVAAAPLPDGQTAIALASFALQSQQRRMDLLLVLDNPPGAAGLQALAALRWLPQLFERERQVRQAERDATRLAQVLETVGRLLAARHLDQAALVLCNDLAERFACESVSLCWRAREGLKLRAISHTEKIDRRSELTAWLEEAGEEALQQGQEIVWPASGQTLEPAHERFAQLQKPGHLYTLPLMECTEGEPRPWGSLTLARQKMPFTRAEQWALRLYADLALEPLLQWHERSRLLPLRLWREMVRSMPKALQARTLAGRRLAQVLLGALALLALVPVPHVVTAGATVKTDTMAFVGAPFDGFLESSAVQLGDPVRNGQALFSVSTRELVLERASIQAEISQASREAEKRRATNQLPEMQVAQAQVAQGQARLQQTQQRVDAAAVVSPMDGVVIEGEPGKNLGGAVRRGDTIVKIAALSALYVEAAVSEKDLSRIQEGQSTRLSLLAQPSQTYTLKVLRIIPQAQVVEGVNAFAVRLELEGSASDWWRPGMTGVAKISVGWRPLGWLATHRLIDYLRIALWL